MTVLFYFCFSWEKRKKKTMTPWQSDSYTKKPNHGFRKIKVLHFRHEHSKFHHPHHRVDDLVSNDYIHSCIENHSEPET